MLWSQPLQELIDLGIRGEQTPSLDSLVSTSCLLLLLLCWHFFLVSPGMTQQVAAIHLQHSVRNLFLSIIKRAKIGISSMSRQLDHDITGRSAACGGLILGSAPGGAEEQSSATSTEWMALNNWLSRGAAERHLALKHWWALESLVCWASAFCPARVMLLS